MYIKEGLFKIKGVQLVRNELDYGSLGEIENLLNKLSSVELINSYITDYFQNKILFVSDSTCRFCGYTHEEVAELGESFYRKIFPAEDLPIHIRISEAMMARFYSLEMADRLSCAASYNFPLIKKDGRRIGVYRRTCPLKWTDDGRLWLTISCVNYSSSDELGGLFYISKFQNKSYSYILEEDRWVEQVPVLLTENEKFTAIEIYRGMQDKHIADILCVSKDTVSYYKKQIMHKTQKKTMRSAIDFLVTHYII